MAFDTLMLANTLTLPWHFVQALANLDRQRVSFVAMCTYLGQWIAFDVHLEMRPPTPSGEFYGEDVSTHDLRERFTRKVLLLLLRQPHPG